jgi:hypothetical protein
VVSNSTGHVLDIENGNVRPGTPVIIYPKISPPSANQQWFFDENGHIRSEKDKLTIQAGQSVDRQLCTTACLVKVILGAGVWHRFNALTASIFAIFVKNRLKLASPHAWRGRNCL